MALGTCAGDVTETEKRIELAASASVSSLIDLETLNEMLGVRDSWVVSSNTGDISIVDGKELFLVTENFLIGQGLLTQGVWLNYSSSEAFAVGENGTILCSALRMTRFCINPLVKIS